MISLAWEGDYPVTQYFGAHPEWYLPLHPGHEGIDIGCPIGTTLRALWDSSVIEVGLNEGNYGYYVKLRAADLQEVVYCHLLPYHLPRPGDVLQAGELAGLTGNSGNSTGPHLHLGWRPNARIRGGPWRGWANPYAMLLA